MSKKVEWKTAPEAKNYAGVGNFLSLLCSKAHVDTLIERFKKVGQIERAGKDLLRAAALPLLGEDDPHVAEDLKEIKKGRPLAPVLLIRGELASGHSLVIADGYHRICASYIVDEGSMIPCRLVDR